MTTLNKAQREEIVKKIIADIPRKASDRHFMQSEALPL